MYAFVLLVAAVQALAFKQHNALSMAEMAVQRGIPCENMCKEMNQFPNCQCPGFGDRAPASDDPRTCHDLHCHVGTEDCPNEGFINCVTERTK